MTVSAPQGFIPTLTEVVDPAQLLSKTAQPLSEAFVQHAEPVLAQCVAQATEHLIRNFIAHHADRLRTDLQAEFTLALRQAVLGALSEPASPNTRPHSSPDGHASTNLSGLP